MNNIRHNLFRIFFVRVLLDRMFGGKQHHYASFFFAKIRIDSNQNLPNITFSVFQNFQEITLYTLERQNATRFFLYFLCVLWGNFRCNQHPDSPVILSHLCLNFCKSCIKPFQDTHSNF